MLRKMGFGIVVLAILSVATTHVAAADLSGEFTANFTIGDFDGTATWQGEQIAFLPLYSFESSTGVTWTALSIGDFAIWRINAGLNPIYFGSVDEVDETGVVTLSGSIITAAGGMDSGTWSASKLALREGAAGLINEAGSQLP